MRESSVLACASSRLDPAVLGALTTSGGSHSEGRPRPAGARPVGPVVNSCPQRVGAAADSQRVFPKSRRSLNFCCQEQTLPQR